MRMKLIYPRWPKLARQTEFHLPPHGPVVFAATVPPEVQLEFVDENREELSIGEGDADVVALSVMLTCQLPRAFAIADAYRALGVPVIAGGIAVMLHADEWARHADAVFLGEAEGRTPQLLDDLANGRLRPVYDHMNDFPDISLVGTARREILKRELYNYRGIQMVDLVHASRGCRFNCFPCCNGFLGGSRFRPRPIDRVVEELASIPNNRLFLVDNSLAQDRGWLVELFTAMKPLKKTWVSHPILDDPEILRLAADAGAWYVYQAVFDTSDVIRDRIRRLRDHGIGVEATVILGTDDHDERAIVELVEFLSTVGVDVCEFTIMTPFPHSPIRAQMEAEGRILTSDWSRYTADQVVFRPKRITPERLLELYHWAWDTFYADGGQQLKMGKLMQMAIAREMREGTYQRSELRRRRGFAGGGPGA